jgi:hypothetical protein
VNNVMTLSCSTQWIQQPVKVKRGFGAVVRTTDSSGTVVRLDGFSSTRPLVGPSDVEQALCAVTVKPQPPRVLRPMTQSCKILQGKLQVAVRQGWGAAAGSNEQFRVRLDKQCALQLESSPATSVEMCN